MRGFGPRSAVLAVLLVAVGCVYKPPIPHEAVPTVYRAEGTGERLLLRFAPVFLAHGSRESRNRIGTPFAEYDGRGGERIGVDPDEPAFYGMDMGVVGHGEGRYVLNTLRLIENLGTDPVADRILFNLIGWTASE